MDCAALQYLGFTCDVLKQELLDSIAAKASLQNGTQPNAVRVGAGDLARDVTYTPANIGNLYARIAELQSYLGQCCGAPFSGRRPIRPFF